MHVRRMMRGSWSGMLLLAALAIGACKDDGGELREATRRRRAELDTTESASDTAPGDTSSRLPAFSDDTAPRARADTGKTDSAKAAPAVATEWTVAVRETKHAGTSTTLRGLRAAANAGFDRLVLDFGDDPVPGWRVEYVDRPVQQCGSGETVELGTPAALVVRLQYTQAHDEAGRGTLRQRDLTLNMPVMRRMVIVCDFEGEVEAAIGTASRQPFRVTELQNPSRLAIDLQQP
ncbi:MAG TPA: hypothetical protein VFJ82_19760 [Longimicrobium sp.]|nr:hypothetical protein [Longimicrobium sp.]